MNPHLSSSSHLQHFQPNPWTPIGAFPAQRFSHSEFLISVCLRLYHAVESFQRATQELLDFQREQQEHHRQYEDRLLAALRWRDTGVPYSRPHTPSIAAHNRTEERFTEKKEIHLRDGFDVRAYPNIPFAAGLAIGIQNIPSWQPVWQVFPLKAFRGSDYTFLKIQPHWDDADLLRELSKTYDRLRTWRKWFSLRNVRYETCFLSRTDHLYMYLHLQRHNHGAGESIIASILEAVLI